MEHINTKPCRQPGSGQPFTDGERQHQLRSWSDLKPHPCTFSIKVYEHPEWQTQRITKERDLSLAH